MDKLVQMNINEMQLRDYFAANAMEAVIQETQEMRVASFWDWCKSLLIAFFNFTFLTVKYKAAKGTYEQAAERSYEYADAMIKVRINTKQ